jgi:hypothetical protein
MMVTPKATVNQKTLRASAAKPPRGSRRKQDAHGGEGEHQSGPDGVETAHLLEEDRVH